MDKLIPVINKLQDVFSILGTQPIDLPQIAVVGSQSAGKSSVLETLVGRDFLPRGNDIVTRRPLILQLFNIKKSGKKNNEWGEFLHQGNKKNYDFDEIRNEIERETERVAPQQAIDDKPINLRIFSPYVLNLTIIDLPGMTKVAVGNQPSDISAKIRTLLLKFIQKTNCLILAVSPANADLANSDAIQLAREVDPKGNRTLGVLTKIDLMDKGTNAMDYLTGKVVPLRLGYIGVKNRSQEDIDNGKTIGHAIRDEEKFFTNHPIYRPMSSQLGSRYLGEKLNTILVNHIKRTLPSIKQEIYKQIEKLRAELRTYGSPLIASGQEPQGVLLDLISKYSGTFCNAINGIAADREAYTTELFGGARILHTFRVLFAGEMNKIGAYDGLSDDRIRTSIRNASGVKACLFVPEVSFEKLVKQQIQKLRAPSLTCVENVLDELKRIAAIAERQTGLVRFDILKDVISDITSAFLRTKSDMCTKFVDQLIEIELSYINTNHPDFISGQRAVSKVEQDPNKMGKPATYDYGKDDAKRESNAEWNSSISRQDSVVERMKLPKKIGTGGSSSERENIEIDLIKILIKSYFDIVKSTILDRVPKAVMSQLVNETSSNLQGELIRRCLESGATNLVKENPEMTAKRDQAQSLLQTLEQCIKIVNTVRDFKA